MDRRQQTWQRIEFDLGVVLLLPFGAASSLSLAAGLVWEGIIITGGLIAGATAFLLRRLGENS